MCIHHARNWLSPLIVAVVLAGCSQGYRPNEPFADTPQAESQLAVARNSTASPTLDSSQQSNRVVLGSPALTAGIPGTGPLTNREIATWLSDPQQHVPLEIELPKGLAAAAANVTVPQDNPLTLAKIELGRQLFFDTRLSVDGSVSCASCHHPDEGYARATRFGIGIDGQAGGRNSPISYNRILSSAQFWDGRAATLEDQAKGPIANPIEMGNTHDVCVATVKNIEGYRLQFEKIFPDGINIDNIARAIASFERVLVTGPTPYDYHEPLRSFERTYKYDLENLETLTVEDPELYAEYQQLLADAQAHSMSESAQRGRDLFFGKANCSACHAGANFTDEQYHNLGIGMESDDVDWGRYAVAEEKLDRDRGAFKTPTLRNVTRSAPYMHDGSMTTLQEVVEWYDKGGHPNPYLSDKMKKLNLTDQEKADLVEFMKALDGDFPQVETGRLPQ